MLATKMTIYAGGFIALEGKMVCYVKQTKQKTMVIRIEDGTEIHLPHQRYALSCVNPASSVPGSGVFEADLLAAIGC